MLEPLKIIAVCVGSAVVYGVIHDQITVRVCLEYFTIGHPPLVASSNPTVIALAWGIVATWWVGLILGIPLSFASQFGSSPKYSAANLLKPVAGLLLIMAVMALLSGISGYFAAKCGRLCLLESLDVAVPTEKHTAFLADLCSHIASYGTGFVVGVTLCIWVWFKRKRIARTVRFTEAMCSQ